MTGKNYTFIKSGKGFEILRNGKGIKTPAGKTFTVPTAILADAIAAEWNAQDPKKPDPTTMPLTQLAATALDIIPTKHDAIVDELVGFVGSELLCHRAEEPAALIQRQAKIWQPLLNWCAEHFDVKLNIGSGIMPVSQTREAVAALRKAIAAHDDFHLTGLQNAAQVSGSLIIALAIAQRQLSAAEAFGAAELDALFQMEKWGEDPALINRHDGIRKELVVCENWFRLLNATA